MALRATVYKVDLQITDLDRQHFAQHTLSLACHPSETEERLLVRLLAFALQDVDGLAFGRGISNDEDATLWQHDLTGRLRLWVEVGLPDERLLRRASGRADRVVLYTYGGRSAALWWSQNEAALARLDNLEVWEVAQDFTLALAALAQRSFVMQLTVQDGLLWLSIGEQTLSTTLLARKGAQAGRG